MKNPQTPTARKEGLVIQELSDEVLVYDLDSNKAHCLNQTAAFVWKACDGKNSIGAIVNDFEKQTGGKVSEDLVWLAIDQLNEKNLLTEGMPRKFEGQNRRQVLKKIGLASVIALPIVASLTAPSAALAVACSGTVTNCVGCPDGTPCDVDMDMDIGMCLGGACAGD
ncbi:hypothetical protein BH20ACI4_BH20ACI4_07230 [soil metagenome]